jgi:predicted lipid-binding transport protein (Tim44 family)
MRLPFILAQAGGGSSGFGGGGGGGSSYGGGGSYGGGSSGDGDPVVFLIIVVIVGLVLAWNVFKAVRLAKKRRERVARTITASAAAADDDAWFAAEDVQRDASSLYHAVQKAWHGRDLEALGYMVGPDLMVEWRRRLDDFAEKGWHNQVEVRTGPEVEYVGIVNREDDEHDTVCVRLTATMRSVVVDEDGDVIKKSGEDSDEVDVAEYWTLEREGDRWIVVSIEQDAEGAHHLDSELVTSPWDDEGRLRDEAIVEQAAADAAPAGTKLAELVDVDFADDAHRAALDLSVVDERFAPHVMEVGARRAVAAWAKAIDGDDAELLAVAAPRAVRRLLYAGDADEKTRVVVRGPRLETLRISSLDNAVDPPVFEVEAELTGRRYVEDRDTLQLLSGSKDDETTFTERWQLELTGDDANPWRIGG